MRRCCACYGCALCCWCPLLVFLLILVVMGYFFASWFVTPKLSWADMALMYVRDAAMQRLMDVGQKAITDQPLGYQVLFQR